MNYFIHRIGRGMDGGYRWHFDALWELFLKYNCLTIGWNCFVRDFEKVGGSRNKRKKDSIINAVESGSSNSVSIATRRAGYTAPFHGAGVGGLENFAEMNAGDIVVVLPISEYYEHFFIVEILTPACSILKVPDYMKKPFTTYILYTDGRDVNFVPNMGFVYDSDEWKGEAVDAGFFHEVKVLNKILRKDMQDPLKTLCASKDTKGTNYFLANPTYKQQIDSMIPRL